MGVGIMIIEEKFHYSLSRILLLKPITQSPF
jgi:hypothetical protein